MKCLVALSGGVDSSLAAFLLKKEGYEVEGLHFINGYTKHHIDEVQKIADFIGINLTIEDIHEQFKKSVVDYFVDEYIDTKTPNPCIMCNRYIKFGYCIDIALQKDCDIIATGHYAGLETVNGEVFIKKGKDQLKDQSYFLSYIKKEYLNKIIFPLSGMNKVDVKRMCAEYKIPIEPNKSESQDICFINDDYRDFLRSYGVKESIGDVIFNGKKVGTHCGLPFYSYGQRRGLNIAVGDRAFVNGYDTQKNLLFLGQRPSCREFLVKKLNVFTANFISGLYEVVVRYHSKVFKAEVCVNIIDLTAMVTLDSQAELVALGQFAVFYKEDYIYASGVISEFKNN